MCRGVVTDVAEGGDRGAGVGGRLSPGRVAGGFTGQRRLKHPLLPLEQTLHRLLALEIVKLEYHFYFWQNTAK